MSEAAGSDGVVEGVGAVRGVEQRGQVRQICVRQLASTMRSRNQQAAEFLAKLIDANVAS